MKELLLLSLDQAFDAPSWHGPNLRGSLRGVKVDQALWRPAADRHSIWDQVLHCAYWKYAVHRRLRGEKKGSFPRRQSNWPIASGEDAKAWKADLGLLVDIHGKLREAIEELGPRQLRATPKGKKTSNLDVITGIAAHDLYHAGQIQLLKRLSQ
ncbi:MAG: DinB family protein [Planctomycetota bacterium]